MAPKRTTRAPLRRFGRDLDPAAVEQMEQAASLPVAVAGALMPDAHVGYGLPIGGVLACDNAVIPFGVGVDIACRVKLTALDLPAGALDEPGQRERLVAALRRQTRFGVGCEFDPPQDHPVMDEDWSVSPVTRTLKDRAWRQLGTSGSGNHFVEYGELTLEAPLATPTGVIPQGRWTAILSHSGSRGAGAAVCNEYSRVAAAKHPELAGELRRLAWLDLDSHEGQEYWRAMELMGRYAHANHDVIHRQLLGDLGAEALGCVENHHNFAWIEEHQGRSVVVHRKGATPAKRGELGVVPGTMADPAYVVRGLGEPESLRSSAHGAGRVMSRRQAKRSLRWRDVRRTLEERRVTLLEAGLDEAPAVYKDIDAVMQQQRDLVEIVARFQPRIVRMAPGRERPED